MADGRLENEEKLCENLCWLWGWEDREKVKGFEPMTRVCKEKKENGFWAEWKFL